MKGLKKFCDKMINGKRKAACFMSCRTKKAVTGERKRWIL
ncbi:hypothetical protein QY97_03570 [Bacillus thermotolerans]|uniref:Uncharacterized protein n=1 Tax=Bacillus thermotolerans TaxID=1221996 RepID=A0A0F5HIS8_BACTR|nr:hypothetical protein QY97_03570 [Bacillus thermotolerans]KKB34361.1 hypothetical protein QY95_03972 [Bacillus thermotolerans]